MEHNNLKNMVNGWFIGDFEPSLYKSSDFEIAVKEYKKGYSEQKHFHRIATEFTVIINGKVLMNAREYVKGDILIIKPNEPTDFRAIEDTSTVVVKIPCVPNDKYLIKE